MCTEIFRFFLGFWLICKLGHVIKCLLTEYEGCTGKDLPHGDAIQNVLCSVRTNDREPNTFEPINIEEEYPSHPPGHMISHGISLYQSSFQP